MAEITQSELIGLQTEIASFRSRLENAEQQLAIAQAEADAGNPDKLNRFNFEKVANIRASIKRREEQIANSKVVPDPRDTVVPSTEEITTQNTTESGRLTSADAARLVGEGSTEDQEATDAVETVQKTDSKQTAAEDDAKKSINNTKESADNDKDSATGDVERTTNVDRSRGASRRSSVRKEEEITTKNNLLKNFSSYSYKLSLYRIAQSDFNRLQLGLGWSPGVEDLLITNAGSKFVDNFVELRTRNRFFDVDFHIDNLEIESLIGLSGRNRNTNTTMLSFTIVEPYGVSLIERLIKVAQSDNTNYLQQPYMLSIEFIGYNDQGVAVNGPAAGIPVKYIPIKITDFNFSVKSSGSEYAIQCIPYNHVGYDILRNVIPFHVELQANNVGSFFNSDIGIYDGLSSDRTDALDVQANAEKFIGRQTKGLAEALTQHSLSLAASGEIEYNDVFAFEIDDEIARGIFNIDDLLEKLEEQKVPMAKNNAYDIRRSISQNISYNKDIKKFTINQGTSISELVNIIVRRSTYITNQIDSSQIKDTDSIRWFKIIPKIELLKYDRIRREYAKKITYVVKTLPVQGRDTVGLRAKMPANPHKIYNYIFTGKNDDVLDFKLDFNALYYQARSILPAALTTNYPVDRANQSTSSVAPISSHPHQSSETKAIGNSDAAVKLLVAGDLMRDLLNNSVDMIELNLSILGDPDYINTTDYHVPSKNSQASNAVYLSDGSINYNSKECYIQMNLKTPIDYNTRTGEMAAGITGESVLLNGIYRLVSVKSTFSRGVFTQDLNGFKLNAFENNTNNFLKNEKADDFSGNIKVEILLDGESDE